MRLVLILIFSLTILLSQGWSLPICNIQTATQALPPRIFFEQTIDGSSQPILLTRFLHNKLGIFSSEIARCYFNVLDPNFILKTVGLIGFITLLYFLYKIILNKNYVLLILFLVLPISPIFGISPLIVVYPYKLFAIIGLLLLLRKTK